MLLECDGTRHPGRQEQKNSRTRPELRKAAGAASGLFLERVVYKNDEDPDKLLPAISASSASLR